MIRFRPVLFLLSFLVALMIITTPAYMRGGLPIIAFSNHTPVANDDAYSRHNDGYIGWFTSNDVDADGDSLTFSIITQPAHGTLSFDYGYVHDHPWYTPAAGFSGQDLLVYKICDPSNACDTATVTITVPNQAPVAVADNYTVHDGGYLGYVTGNDSDPDGDSFVKVEYVSQPSHGTVSEGAWRPWYSPAVDYSGTDSFQYRICDRFDACATATVTVNVTNKPPVAIEDRYTVTVGRFLGVLNDNDYDPDGDSVTVKRIVTQPSHGTLYYNQPNFYPPNRPWYEPQAGYSGKDSFVYELCDRFNACSEATVYINEDAKNNGKTKCQENAGEPINVTNGNMYLQQQDYQLPGSMNFTRTYNSHSQRVRLFGRGWSTLYDETITWYGVNDLQLFLADGRAIDFTRQSGVYVPVQGDFAGQIIQNADGSFTLTMKDGSVHQFSKPGKLLWLKDENNNQTTLAYDSAGKLSSVTDPFGRGVSITTNSDGRVLSISDSMGPIASYSYGSSNELLSVTYADNSGYQFTYGSPDLVLYSVADAMGNVLEAHTYDTHGRALTSQKQGGVELYTFNYVSATETQVTDALSRVTKYTVDKSKSRNLVTKVEGTCGCGGSQIETWAYDNQLNLTSKTDALNHTTSYTYDTGGNRLTETDATGTITFTYNSLGQVLTRTDQMSGVWTNTYDARGNLLTAKDPLNKTTTLVYNGLGQLETVTDPRDNTTTFTYDSNGNLTRRKDALNNQTNMAYDARGRITSVTNALNQVTGYEYDAAGRLKKVIYPDTNFELFTFDLAGRRTKVKDPRGYETDFTYDAAYRLISKTNADNKTTSYSYDLMSNLTGVTDPLNRTTNYEFDGFNRLKKIKYPEATIGAGRLEENFTYDLAGKLLEKTDQANRITSFGYDNANRLTTTTDPALKATTFEYNSRSQMTALVDAIGQRYEFVYDALGRRTQEKKGTATRSFVYDAAGNRSQRTDYNGAITNYNNDALNRLTTISYPDSTSATYGYDVLSRLTTATNPTGTVTMAYDNRSRVSSVTDVFGQVVSYSYDASSNRTQLNLNGSLNASYQYDVINRLTQLTDNASLNATFAYDAANKLTSRTLPNGVVSTSQYDGLDRLTRLTDAKAGNTLADFQYQLSSVNNITQITDSAGPHNYTYDTRDRLTAATHPSQPNESYTLDDVGNRTASHQGSSYAYQTFNHLDTANSSTFSYDANGNLISKTDASGSWTYEWDYENRLKQAVLSGGITVSYSYDALGRRIQRSSSSGNTTKFVYDGEDVIRDLDSSGSSIAEYLNGPGVDNKLRQTAGGTAYYFVADHLGTTRALTDASGAITSSISYDSYGSVSGGSISTRYTYTGREADPETGLMYYRARWYDPDQGRFISEDPIGLGGGVNLFGYVANNPTGFSDPSGLCPQETRPNSNCIMNAVVDRNGRPASTGLARPFGNVGPTGIIGHDGVHAVAPAGSRVRTLPALTGTVLGRPRDQGDGLIAQDVLLDGGNVAIYKDLATVSVRPGQRLRAGTVIGTVGSGGENLGLHFALLRGGRDERTAYRGLTSTGQSNKITVGMFINPLGPNSPVNCPGVPVNNAGVNPHP